MSDKSDASESESEPDGADAPERVPEDARDDPSPTDA